MKIINSGCNDDWIRSARLKKGKNKKQKNPIQIKNVKPKKQDDEKGIN